MPDATSILSKLNEVEEEMKAIGYWSKNPSDLQPKIASGEIKNYTEAPSFELWLQTVFLPNAREACRTNVLPKQSQVGVMALRQYDYHSSVPEAHRLMKLLFEFDKLVILNSR
jgi:uncharacterized protein YqcC (DUF446 family)